MQFASSRLLTCALTLAVVGGIVGVSMSFRYQNEV